MTGSCSNRTKQGLSHRDEFERQQTKQAGSCHHTAIGLQVSVPLLPCICPPHCSTEVSGCYGRSLLRDGCVHERGVDQELHQVAGQHVAPAAAQGREDTAGCVSERLAVDGTTSLVMPVQSCSRSGAGQRPASQHSTPSAAVTLQLQRKGCFSRAPAAPHLSHRTPSGAISSGKSCSDRYLTGRVACAWDGMTLCGSAAPAMSALCSLARRAEAEEARTARSGVLWQGGFPMTGLTT